MKRFFAFAQILLLAAGAAGAQGRFNYAEHWKTIDKLMEGILPQSAPALSGICNTALCLQNVTYTYQNVTYRLHLSLKTEK